MIQDILPHHLENRYDPSVTPGPDSYVIHFRGDEILVRDVKDLVQYPLVREFFSGENEAEIEERLTYLFSVDDETFFLYPQKEAPVPDGFIYVPMPKLRRMEVHPRHMLFAAFTAQQLAGWYRDNVYCGTCGQKTEHSKRERALVCPACGRTIYPRILPAVIVGVTNGDKLLITRYADRPLAVDALVAGFTEIGETLEETVRREVMEEVGLRVKNIRYYKSQPWGIADDILMGFYCDVDGDDTIRIDRNELKEGRWVERKEIQGQPTDFSLTNEMMTAFREGLV